MKNVKNDPSPRSEALGGKQRGLGPAAPRGAHPPPAPPPPTASSRPARPGLQASAGRFAELPLAHRPRRCKGRKMATGPRAPSLYRTHLGFAKKAAARRSRRPRRRPGPRALRRPPSPGSRTRGPG